MSGFGKWCAPWAVAAGLAVSAGGRAAAAEPPGGRGKGPPEVVMLEEIVVKTGREPRVETLEVREVREGSARDLGEALETQGGAAKVRKAGIANDVVLRGLQKDSVNVLVDGARVHGACPSRMDPPSFHLDYAEVDRVEVTKGPFDVTNPGGLGGLVEVRTRRARAGPGGELNLQHGSFQATDLSAVGSWGGPAADLQVGGAFKYAEPYRSGDGLNLTEAVPAAIAGQPNPARYRNTGGAQEAYAVGSGWAKLGVNPAEGHRVEASYARQSADDVLYPYLLMDGITDTTDRINVRYTVDGVEPLSRGLLQVYWSQVSHAMDDRKRCSAAAAPATCSGALPLDWSMRTEARAEVVGGKLELELDGWAAWRVGGDVYSRSWDNTTVRAARAMPGLPYLAEATVPDVTIVDFGMYGSGRKRLGERVQVTAGLRFDTASTQAKVDRTALYRTFYPGGDLARLREDVLLSGNLQVDVEVAPGAVIFAGYGHGNRLPDPQERYYALSGMMGKPAWVGKPGLEPMRSDEVDLGARYGDGRLLARAQLFYDRVGSYITLASVTAPGTTLAAKSYANVRAHLYGGEASARWALPAHLVLSAGLSYTRGVDDTAGGDLAEMPPLRASASLRWEVDRFFAEVEEVVAARQDRVATGLNEQPTPAWFITNVRAGGRVAGVKLFAGARNLLDKSYTEHLAYLRDPFATGTRVPEPGRSLYAALQAAF